MAKQTIPARQFVHDVQQGLSDYELMAKYSLSPSGLEKVMDKLVLKGLIQDLERQVQEDKRSGVRCPECCFTIPEGVSECPRCGVVLPKIMDSDNPGKVWPGDTELYSGNGLRSTRISSDDTSKDGSGIIPDLKQAMAAIFIAGVFVTGMVQSYSTPVQWIAGGIFVTFFLGYGIVVLIEAFRESFTWGLVVFFLIPGGTIFVILHLNSSYRGMFVPKLWLAAHVGIIAIGRILG